MERDGKHLTLAGVPLKIRGVTYGSFRPRSDGEPFPPPARIKADFEVMAAVGLNTVRTYALPPPDVLELAEHAGLRLIVGAHYEDWRYHSRPGRRARRNILDAGRRAVAEALERCAGRGSVTALSVGNEVPADVVRVHGISAVEDALSSLVAEVHEGDPAMLATYTSYPTTEYLRVDGQDLVSFNVFLERPEQLSNYLRHLQVVAHDLPLLITELGLASAIHGEGSQASSLAWQLATVDSCGCVGATVFSWTDEWSVDGVAVEGWEFGLTDSERRPKPALDVVGRWARASLRDLRARWPRISAVVCAYNAAESLADCIASLHRSDYPDLEVIVCDDGSTDETADVAERHAVRVLRLPHRGLGAARNAGIAAAGGEIVAFIDADAACHPDWPYHLALSLEDDVAGTGGPNLPMPSAGFVERAVARSPGGPAHVLLSDDRAEHVPGCNMAFRKRALEDVGGFDPVYEAAGDDVDACWKLLDRGYQIGFSAAAQVMHRRRSTVRGYLRQQHEYGKAERLVSRRHGHRFNGLGQARWRGFLYGRAHPFRPLLLRVIHHGSMGTAPFQPVVGRRGDAAASIVSAVLPLMLPLALLGLFASVFIWALAVPAIAVVAATVYAVVVALSVQSDRAEERPVAFRLLVAFLHLAQPLARAWGRLRSPRKKQSPHARVSWSGDRTTWLEHLRLDLSSRGCFVRTGNEHDAWDLHAAVGPLLKCRVTTAILWRWSPAHRVVLRPTLSAVFALAVGIALAVVALAVGAVVLGVIAVALVVEGSLLMRAVRQALAATMHSAELAGSAPTPSESERRASGQAAAVSDT